MATYNNSNNSTGNQSSTSTSNSTSMVYANGTAINKKTNPHTAKIYMGLEVAGQSTNSATPLNQSAQILLNELGYAISTESKNFSLEDNDPEIVENENIFQQGVFTSLAGSEQLATDSFIDPNDPFFQLDNAIPDNYRVQIEESTTAIEPSVVALAATLAGKG